MLDYANTGDPAMISKGGDFTVVVATVGAVQEKQAVTALERAIAAQPSLKGNSWLGGPTVADVQLAAVSSQDLGHAELYALPFLVLLLFFVFRGLRAAAVPLLGAVFAIAVTLGVMGLVMLVVPLSVFALNLVIALGLGLSVDFSLLIVSAFREEFGRQGSVQAALATARQTAGHTVLFSSVTIAAAMATLAIFPERFVYSMGIAGAIVVLAAGAFALFVLPSLLAVFGERVAAPARSRRSRPATTSAPEAKWPLVPDGHSSSCAGPSSGRRPPSWCWWSWPHRSSTSLSPAPMRAPCRPVARPAPPTNWSRPGSPPSLRRRPASWSMRRRPRNACRPMPAAAAVPGVKAVSSFQHLGGLPLGVQRGPVLGTTVAGRPARRRGPPVAARSREGRVIGQTASFLSLQNSLKSHLPSGARADRTDRARDAVRHDPLGRCSRVMAVVMNIFTIGATFGVLVWAFQWGHLRQLLGFSAPGALQSTSLIIILAVVFGLSTDYGVFLLGRMKEEHDAGATPDEAVARGLDRTGGIVSAAAVCLALAMGALVLSRLVFVKELGLGVAFAVSSMPR